MRGASRAALVLALLMGSSARAELSGSVFLDANGDGARQAGEIGVAGVAVTNGREVVRSDAQGRYVLPNGGRFVYVTRPDGYLASSWYRPGAGDFALVPAPTAEEFFFIQISDSHVYDRLSDFADYSSPGIPWFVPEIVVDWLTLRILRSAYGDDAADELRRALAPYRETEGLSDLEIYRAYSEELARPGSPLGRIVEETRAAFAEVEALGPELVIATGDLVLESNQAPPDVVERWFRFYASLADGLSAPVYHTIGNNEIAGIQYDGFGPDDPRYGKYFFREFFGPTYYSFDRGPFHFVALDTHEPRGAPEDEDWTFARLPDEVRTWLLADLAAHPDRVGVVLNHEPFHYDPAWPFDPDPDQTADDEQIFSQHGVDYVLSGHTHWNSFMRENGTVHLTTGALSGLRWVLPPDLHPRGYRLFYASDGQLQSAWKATGEVVITRAEGAARSGDLVVVAADRSGPFASLEVKRGGQPLPYHRWGRYFLRVPLQAGHSGAIEVTGVRADGTRERAEIEP